MYERMGGDVHSIEVKEGDNLTNGKEVLDELTDDGERPKWLH